jgi:ATP-dependent helicase Lhr and Lhr-like helicase
MPRAGEIALLVAPTGGGKTLAGFLPSWSSWRAAPVDGLHTLYVSPLKALAVDIAPQPRDSGHRDELPVRIESRTGDTPPANRVRQRTRRRTSC